MAKAVKLRSPEQASKTFHAIIAASVKGNPKPRNMTQDKIDKHRTDMQKKLDKYTKVLEANNTGGISTSKRLFEDALKAWEDACAKFNVKK